MIEYDFFFLLLKAHTKFRYWISTSLQILKAWHEKLFGWRKSFFFCRSKYSEHMCELSFFQVWLANPFFTIFIAWKRTCCFCAHSLLPQLPLQPHKVFFVTHSFHARCFFRKNVFMLIWKTEKVYKKVLVPQTFGVHGYHLLFMLITYFSFMQQQKRVNIE